MVNAEGEFVVAEPDKASWESYQAKANTSVAKAEQGSKELRDKGIECGHCHKLYKDAVRTPCCEKTFCEECIQQQLLDSDFVCPVCETKEVLLEKLVPDTETRTKVDEHIKEKAKNSPEPAKTNGATTSQAPHTKPVNGTASGPAPSNNFNNINRKRPAEDIPNAPRGPAAMRNQHNTQTMQNNNFRPPQPQPPMQPQMPFFPSFQAPMPFPPNQPFFNGPMGPGFMPGFGPAGPMPMFNPMGGPPMPMSGPYGFPGQDPNFGFQQGPMFGGAGGYDNEEDSAYMRPPVNPHRHGRVKRVRQADFKALGGE